jgi:hypothetical protein
MDEADRLLDMGFQVTHTHSCSFFLFKIHFGSGDDYLDSQVFAKAASNRIVFCDAN